MSDIAIHGRCDPRFQAVADAFQRNFDEFNELGACVSLSVDGETVVDLWGGHQDEEREKEWQENALCVVFSCTKAATALCTHMLIDRGELRLDDKVAAYWPEFAQAGKSSTTVAMMLDHSAGLPALRGELQAGDAYDWNAMVKRLEAESPFWEPGSRHGYHMTTFGWLVGELVRRVSGKSLGAFFRDEIAEPLDLDFWIGLPQQLEERVAPVRIFRPDTDTPKTDFAGALLADKTSIQFLSFSNTGTGSPNRREFNAAELGGHGGVSNARAMAKMMTPLANGGGYLSRERIDAMRAVAREGIDSNLLLPTRFGQGFMLRMDNRAPHRQEGHSLIIGERAFGHVGLGGSTCFADPEARLAFGYAMNRHGGGLLLNERGQSLIDAAYKAAGFSL